VTVSLSLREPSRVLLLASGEIGEPGTPTGPPDGLDVSVGLDNGSFEGQGDVRLSEADEYSAPLSVQRTVDAPAGQDRFALSVSGFVSRSAHAYGAHLVAIALPASG
jgi:hypothetical protein